MKRSLQTVVLFAIVALTATDVALSAPVPSSEPACKIEGWSADPEGLTVRAQPAITAPVLGKLPPFVADDDGDYGPIFSIKAAHDGWLQIANVRDSFRPSDLPARPSYNGEGWVHGSWVRLGIQSSTGYEKPTEQSAKRIVIGRNSWLTDSGQVDAVVDCTGDWVKVKYTLPVTISAQGSKKGAAWFTHSCSDQRTTCEGANR